MSIVDYQTLEAEVKKYVYNRSDLTARLPTFVQIAERKIFRKLEHRQNEVLVTATSTPTTTAWLFRRITNQ